MKKGIILITLLCSILMYSKVKAVEYTTEVKAESSSYFDINNASAFTCNTWDTCQFNITPNNGTMQSWGIHINQNYNTINKDFIEFSFMLSQPIYDNIQGTQNDVICTEWTQSGQVYRCSNTYYNNLIETETNQPALTTFNFMPKVVYTNNNSAFCDIQGNKIICPTYHLQIATLEIHALWNYNNQNTNAVFLFSKVANNLYYNNSSKAIENQTNEIINGTLAETPNKDFTNQTQELNDYSTAEEQILNSLDFSGVNQTTVTINPNASLFIWNIVDRLRSMSGAIVLLMTSIFGIGIIKLVLNR